jgi:uncharacterized protein (TIRG00374 family)
VKSRLGWLLKVAAGLALFWIAFHDVDPRALAGAFALVNYWWLLAAVLSVLLTVSCVVVRWRLLLGAGGRAGGTAVLFCGVIASQVANIVMPFKLGDAVRISAVSRALRLPPAELLASVAVERLYDAGMVALASMLLVLAGALPSFAFAGMLSLSLTMTAAITVALSMQVWPRIYRRLWDAASHVAPARVRARVGAELEQLARGVRRTSRPATIVRALAISACVMGGSIATAFLVMKAFGMPLPLVAAAVLVIVVQIGNVVVPVPGAVGVSQVLTVQTLALWQVSEAQALAYALVLYFVSRVPKLLLLPFAMSILASKTAGAHPS